MEEEKTGSRLRQIVPFYGKSIDEKHCSDAENKYIRKHNLAKVVSDEFPIRCMNSVDKSIKFCIHTRIKIPFADIKFSGRVETNLIVESIDNDNHCG